MVDIELNKRNDIQDILNNHLSFTEYAQYCRSQYGFSQARCSQLWKEMWEDIRGKFQLEREKLITKHLDKYWALYQAAILNRDVNTARQVLNDIAKIQGLYEPEKVDFSQEMTIKFKFGDDPQNNEIENG